ncbi:MAG: Fic family protein [Kineosporiaceae bacterium]|jgi:death-on-curing protein
MSVRYLTLDLALSLLDQAGLGPVRDVGLLDSAINRPAASAFGVDAYPSIGTKAAALMHSLAKNHPLIDGNKRAAWHLTRVFCGINGAEVSLSADDAVELVLDIAISDLDDVAKIAGRLGRA